MLNHGPEWKGEAAKIRQRCRRWAEAATRDKRPATKVQLRDALTLALRAHCTAECLPSEALDALASAQGKSPRGMTPTEFDRALYCVAWCAQAPGGLTIARIHEFMQCEAATTETLKAGLF